MIKERLLVEVFSRQFECSSFVRVQRAWRDDKSDESIAEQRRRVVISKSLGMSTMETGIVHATR